MTKLSAALIASAALLTLSACDGMTGYDCSDNSKVASKQWSKERAEYCTAMKLKEGEHSHKDGTTHVHNGGDLPHYHELDQTVYGINDGVFSESDNDYSKESTTDYTEDDAELIGNVKP